MQTCCRLLASPPPQEGVVSNTVVATGGTGDKGGAGSNRAAAHGTAVEGGRQGSTFRGTSLLFTGSHPQRTVLANQWSLW
jgi:hypothetical protein